MNKITALLAVAFISLSAAAQINTPYSMYGYGIIGDRATSAQRQMGGVGYAMNSGRQINVMNPASYAAIDSLTFLFDLGADISFLHSQENSDKQNSIGGGVDYLTMQFPICKFMGGSVGLVPYTQSGYAFGNSIAHGSMENQGSGGINELYLGFAGKVAGFSLGVNISYDFGNIVNDVYSNIAPTGGQVKYEHVMEIRDWNINIGAQYTLRWNQFHKMVAGVTYSPKKTFLGNTWVTMQEMMQDSKPERLGDMKLKNNYYSPNTVGAGLSYTYSKSYSYTIEADYTWQQWSKTKYSALYSPEDLSLNKPKELLSPAQDFFDRTKIALGGEYIPKLRGNYAERIAYRLGGYYSNDYLNINGNRVKEYGVSCGFGLPTPEGKTLINLGLEYKHRNASPQKLISENYFNITLGVNFNEVWFWKRKIR